MTEISERLQRRIMLGSGDDRVQKPSQRSESRGVRTGFKGTAILLSGAPTSFVAPLAFLLHDEEEEDPAQILGQVIHATWSRAEVKMVTYQ